VPRARCHVLGAACGAACSVPTCAACRVLGADLCRVPRARCRLVPRAACSVPTCARCRVLGAACRVPRARCSVPRAACSVPRARCSVLGAACRVLGAACSVQRAACSVPRAGPPRPYGPFLDSLLRLSLASRIVSLVRRQRGAPKKGIYGDYEREICGKMPEVRGRDRRRGSYCVDPRHRCKTCFM